MRWIRLALLAVTIGAASCAMDGGSSGTGITTAEGNVVAIDRPAPAPDAMPRPGVAGIEVLVEGTDAQGATDADGRFVVRGRFDGRATLLFRRAEDRLQARMAIDVPSGGTLTLPNVRLDVTAERATAERPRIVCDALVAATDCAGRTLTLVSLQHPDGDGWYALRLDGSFLHDRDGAVLACADVREGARVHVRGLVNDDWSFGDADVEVVEP